MAGILGMAREELQSMDWSLVTNLRHTKRLFAVNSIGLVKDVGMARRTARSALNKNF